MDSVKQKLYQAKKNVFSDIEKQLRINPEKLFKVLNSIFSKNPAYFKFKDFEMLFDIIINLYLD